MPNVMPNNNLSGPTDHTKICMYTPKYIEAIKHIFESYKIVGGLRRLIVLHALAKSILSNRVITSRLDRLDDDLKIDDNKEYTSPRQKMRDVRRIKALVDKEISSLTNYAFEILDMKQRFKLVETLEQTKKLHCTTHMKEEDDLTLEPIDYYTLSYYGGKRKTKHRRSKRKTRKLK